MRTFTILADFQKVKTIFWGHKPQTPGTLQVRFSNRMKGNWALPHPSRNFDIAAGAGCFVSRLKTSTVIRPRRKNAVGSSSSEKSVKKICDEPQSGSFARIGALLFVLWSVLHVWVGYAGLRKYLTQGTPGLWNLLIGGVNVPRAAFQHSTDTVTVYAQGQLLLNFCIDVGGYGVLGLFVAWMIWTRCSWTGYFIGLVVIGIADLTFLFAMVTSGVIESNAGSVGGPVIWFVAVAITPFGLPKFRKNPQS